MIDMALPLHEAEQRQTDAFHNIITPDFRREVSKVEPALPPWLSALDHFLNNGNATYVKNWVETNIERVPENQRVIFLNTMERRGDFFFEMLTSLRQVELSAVINEFLSRDWD